MRVLQNDHSMRYMRLESLLKKTGGDERNLFEVSKEKSRGKLAEQVKPHLVQAKPGRLLKLLTQAINWQKHMGVYTGDVFGGIRTAEKGEEVAPKKVARQIRFGGESHPETCCFSPDGQYFISGSVDGFIEVWDIDVGVLRKDLSYQEEEAFMMHDASVACTHVNRDSSLLAAGDSAGVLKVWDLESGQCMRRMQAHQAGITGVMIHKDNHQVLSTSFDGVARLHALKSGQLIKEYGGHESYVNQGKFSLDCSQVVTVSSDGHVRVFDARTSENLHTYAPPTPAHLNSALQLSVLAVEWAPAAGPTGGGKPTLYVLTKSNTIFHLTVEGKLLKTYSSGKVHKEGG